MKDKLMPWRMAIIRRQVMLPMIITMTFFGDYWRTWNEVYQCKK